LPAAISSPAEAETLNHRRGIAMFDEDCVAKECVPERSAYIGGISTDQRASPREKLLRKKQRLENELVAVNAGIAAFDANPGFESALDAWLKAEGC
jgi:hypothetical protein